MAVNRGRLIALEGLDGCGKTTQAARIAGALRARGREVVVTREPSDGPIGTKIRALARGAAPPDAERELALFTDDRREHVALVIEPALAAGRWVITDRYFLSTVAYQGARGLDWRAILANSEASFPAPDAALLFELPAAQGLARARARGGAPDLWFEHGEYLSRVAKIFAAIDRAYLARVDATGSAEAVTDRALGAIYARLGLD
ncbi:MAG: dTMP kinase [Deltaproteobacteria bacterium]|nr:MAG: dTMP kinase [Deltaproteobacteria bacterium]